MYIVKRVIVSIVILIIGAASFWGGKRLGRKSENIY